MKGLIENQVEFSTCNTKSWVHKPKVWKLQSQLRHATSKMQTKDGSKARDAQSVETLGNRGVHIIDKNELGSERACEASSAENGNE